MSFVALWLLTLVIFLAVDAVMLTRVMKPLFDRHLGPLMAPEPRLGVAAVFYVFYVAGLVWFAGLPALAGGPLTAAFRDGAILGLMAYGTYEFVNMATLKGWSWRMVAADTAWGALLSGGAVVAGAAAARVLGLGLGA